LGQTSSKKDNSPYHFGKGTVEEQVLDSFIPITADALLTPLPIFPSDVVFG
jgi:hypothetical protein